MGLHDTHRRIRHALTPRGRELRQPQGALHPRALHRAGRLPPRPPKKFHRLSPGAEVRLRHAWLITCREAVLDENGEVVELRCVYDPESRGGQSPDGRKV